MSLDTIRLGTSSDVPQIVNFVMELARYEKLEHEVLFDQDQYRQYLFEERHEPAPNVLLAEDASKQLGFALFIRILPLVFHLEDLFVSVEARGRGTGKRLLSDLARTVIENQGTTLEWACLDWNKPSLDFYYALGAVPITNRVLYRKTGESLKEYPVFDSFEEDPETSEFGRKVSLPTPTGSASVWYTLSFTTFLATPVLLVTKIEAEPEHAIKIFMYLSNKAVKLGYKRIDIRIDPSSQFELADRLVRDLGAFELKGWIPISLSGEALRKLANIE
jgi:GNAT superfamily N-acetyltransferase